MLLGLEQKATYKGFCHQRDLLAALRMLSPMNREVILSVHCDHMHESWETWLKASMSQTHSLGQLAES